jgi:putative hydrolase of the HAD superfamily
MVSYRGLLLDFGSVIMKSFFETHRPFERILGLPEGTLTWMGPLDPVGDPLWRRMQEGEISERDYWRLRAGEVGRMVGEDWAIQDFCRKQNEIPLDQILRGEALRLIADAKLGGIKLGILTNELELFHGADWLASMPFLHNIDVIIDATHTLILKPDPRAYQLALDGLALPAAEVVFIDDQIRNVRGADAVGIHGIHLDVTAPDRALAAARELLGL